MYRRTAFLISVTCNKEFWILSPDYLSGYIKAQAFSILILEKVYVQSSFPDLKKVRKIHIKIKS